MKYRNTGPRASASLQLDLVQWPADQDRRERMSWPARRLARRFGLMPTVASVTAAELFGEGGR